MTPAQSLLPLYIFLAGGLGALSRYGVSLLLTKASALSGWPFHTLMINVVGSFLIGWLATTSSLPFSTPLSAPLKMILMVGFLGGFTTYSSFSLDIVKLSQSSMTSTLGYVLLSLILGVVFCALGYKLGQS